MRFPRDMEFPEMEAYCAISAYFFAFCRSPIASYDFDK
jgi:hypothetical protein